MKKFYILLIALFTVSGASAQIGSTCLPEGITFSSQAQIDDFQINYPSCIGIEGSVTIMQWGGSITNLYGLSVISSIGGNLTIKYNGELTSLTGLDSLNTIGGNLSIEYNNALTTMAGLENLISINGSLSINSNESLISLTGLNNLTSIWGYLNISNNPALNSLTGLDNISRLNIVHIINNCSLSTCEMQPICDAMYYDNCEGQIEFYNNATGCNSTEEVEAGCRVCACSTYGIHLSSQIEIDSFQINYHNCSKIAGALWIAGNDITNLYGLSDLTNIRGIGGEMQFGLNINGTNLTSLTGLENLTYIGTELEIYGNAALTSLSGIDNVVLDGTLDIRDNSSLSNCDVQSICDFLAAPVAEYYISGNANGCSNEGQVIAACEAASVDEMTLKENSLIHPNPASSQITVELPTTPNINLFLTIMDITGKQILTHQMTEQQTVVDVAELPLGIYFVRANNDRTVMVGKFVKQ